MHDVSPSSDLSQASSYAAPQGHTATKVDQWLGTTIDGRYRVIELIGHGGMGVVYKVEHLRIGRIAAMKVLHGELAQDPGVITRFRHEAKAVSMLHHPNTVQIFDFGTTDGALYLIMEYCRGNDLSAVIENHGPLEVHRLAPLMGQICGSLSEAHSLGIVHRDLKPENILVTRTQRGRDFVKVLDFGLAKIGERDEASDITGRGLIIGTPYYMSPEQIRGDPVDARSDIYSLGATMYTALTGVPPFVANTPVGVLSKHLTAPVVPPSQCEGVANIPAQIDDLVVRAMAKSPRDRFQSIAEFIDANEKAYATFLSASQKGALRPLSPWGINRPLSVSDSVHFGIESDVRLRRTDLDSYQRSMRRGRRLRIALVPLVLLCVLGVGIYTTMIRPGKPKTEEHEPNNDIYEATRIHSRLPVAGYLGKRITKAEPDRDYYRLEPPPTVDGTTHITVTSTPLPNIDIELLLFDDSGKLLFTADEGGIGLGEAIRNYRIRSPVIAMISESARNAPQLPTENVSDQYTITATYGRITNTMEIEPNNTAGTSTSLSEVRPITGHLDGRRDQDWFRFTGKTGTYLLNIEDANNIPVTWQIVPGKSSRLRKKKVTLNTGDILILSREDHKLPYGQPLPGASSPYTIRLSAK